MKFKYLYRLISLVVLVLLFPAIVIYIFFSLHTMKELKWAKNSYYESKIDAYVSLFNDKIRELDVFAGAISAESRIPGNVFYNGAKEIYDNAYQIYILVNELKKNYSRYDFSDWGIYFYDIDKMITTTYASL